MERNKLDNGLLILAYISNLLGPLGIIVYFAINYLEGRSEKDELIVLIPLSIFIIIFLFMFARFKKIEFDDQYVYIKSILNSEIDSFPIRNIKSVKQMMLAFGGKGRKRSGKNYVITYTNNNGIEKKVKVMSTIKGDVIDRFKNLTAFLGPDGFNPE